MWAWYTTVASFLFPAYFFLDINYFIRFFVTIIYSRLRKKIHFLEPSSIYGLVLTSDIDFLLTHMNNSRYLRELDFARLDHGIRSGFWQETMRRGGGVLLTSSFIRYRLPLPIFSRYKIVTNVVWWDEKNIYLNHKVITLRDNIIRAVIYARATCVNINVVDTGEAIFPGLVRPENIAPDYKKWMETLELSSKLMKANMANGNRECDSDNHEQQNIKKTEEMGETKENMNGEIVNGNPTILSCSLKSNQSCSPQEKVSLMHQD